MFAKFRNDPQFFDMLLQKNPLRQKVQTRVLISLRDVVNDLQKRSSLPDVSRNSF